MDSLRQCDFCQSSRVHVHRDLLGKYYCECMRCNARTKPKETHDAAVKAWNSRAATRESANG